MDHSSSLYLALDRLISICDKLTDSNGLQLKLTPTYFGKIEDSEKIYNCFSEITDVCNEYFKSHPMMIIGTDDYVQLGIIANLVPPPAVFTGKNITSCTKVCIYSQDNDIPAHIKIITRFGPETYATFITASELRELLRQLYPLELLGKEGSDPAAIQIDKIESKRKQADNMHYGLQPEGFSLITFFEWFNLMFYKELLEFNSSRPHISPESGEAYSISNNKLAIMIHNTIKGGRRVIVSEMRGGGFERAFDQPYEDSDSLKRMILAAFRWRVIGK